MGRIIRWCSAVALGLLVGVSAVVFAKYIRGAEEGPPSSPKVVLESALSGTWYPAERAALAREIDECLAAVEGVPVDEVHALIQPHAAYRYSGGVAAHGLRAIKGKTFRRVVVLGPSHSQSMPNLASLPDATHYRTPLGDVPLDTNAMSALLKHDCIQQIPAAHANEHSVQIQIPLLQHALGEFELVPLVIGQLDDATTIRMAGLLRDVVDSNTLVIASTDFTHYGEQFQFVPFKTDIPENIRKLDMGAWEQIQGKDALGFRAYCHSTGATICGRNAVAVMMAMLPAEDAVDLLKYDTSGRMTGDFSHSVSYLSAAVRGEWPQGRDVPVGEGMLSLSEQDTLLQLARETLVHLLQEGRVPAVAELQLEPTPCMQMVSSAFVTLTRDNKLRGCIGDIYPHRPLFESVMENATLAAVHDRRFAPVTAEELPDVRIEISVLSPPRPISSIKEIQLGRHGIVLSTQKQRAVFLPSVPIDLGWTLEETLEKLAVKAGLPKEAWKSGARFEVFEAEVFKEGGRMTNAEIPKHEGMPNDEARRGAG